MGNRLLQAIAVALAATSSYAADHIPQGPGDKACPSLCSTVGPDSANWTVFRSVDRLANCDAPMVLDFAVFTPLDDPSKATSIFACALPKDDASGVKTREMPAQAFPGHRGVTELHLRQTNSTNSTGAADTAKQQASALWNAPGNTQLASTAIITQQVQQLETFVQSQVTALAAASDSGPSIYFLHHSQSLTSIGIYAGSGIKTSPLSSLFVDFVQERGYGGDSVVQACGPDGGSATGIVASTGPQSLVQAQRAVKAWANATCVTSGYKNQVQLNVSLQSVAIEARSRPARIQARAACKTVKVESGNLCADLAKKCGISTTQLLKYNPQKNFCTTLKVPQLVCCSSGDLPVPKPDSNGNCATYKVKGGDSCYAITQAQNGLISTDDLEKYNKKTWGWGTCNNLQANTVICISSGNPPLPLPVTGAKCGPIKPGTIAPPTGTDLADLNPCPLNACCGVWGYCGTTPEFCEPIPSKQAPGAPQKAGGPICISNCGNDIKNNGTAPASFFKVGYFEGYGLSRKCDRVDIRSINLNKYTHIHFAFATVTPDTFKVDMGPTKNQFYYFKQIKGVKKILSFGGWSFSTDLATYGIFRTGVRSANRDTLAQNIADFIVDNDLDGVDIDWEYPAAPDLPDIPEGDPEEGLDYLKFLATLKKKLPSGKSVSFAAPASYWYLQGFPIDKIMKVVDYVIYMTYDLHGQWDCIIPKILPGCPGGNCLRSHVNLTETMGALSMITKAGVHTNQIVVGVTSYGRSFKMTNPSCTGPMCTFTGPESGASKGKCTGTAGYISNAEIQDIIDNNPSPKTSTDDKTDSSILTYDGNWVAYMDDKIKEARTKRYKDLNFLGTTDWAISLDTKDLVDYDPSPIEIGPNETFPLRNLEAKISLHYSCQNDKFREIILQSWKEAGELSEGFKGWDRDTKYQKALELWVGPRMKEDAWLTRAYYNFLKNWNAHGYSFWWGNEDMRHITNYFYCDETLLPTKVHHTPEPCKEKNSGEITAAVTYRFPDAKKKNSEYYTLLCPVFLDDRSDGKTLKSLAEQLEDAEHFKSMRDNIDAWATQNRAVYMYHETDVTDPHCDSNEEYIPENIAWYSQKGGTDGFMFSVRNAHSWTLAVTSMYLMKKFNLATPPTHQKDIPTKAPRPRASIDDDWFDPSQIDPSDFTSLRHYGSTGGNASQNPCSAGTWTLEMMCEMNCGAKSKDDKRCSENSDGTWECKCEKEPTDICSEGEYKDGDECSEFCHLGLCSLNAGDDGPTWHCISCP